MRQTDSQIEPASAMTDERMSAGEQVYETWRKRLGAILVLPAFVLTYFVCSGLTPEGQTLAAILAAVTVMWVMPGILQLPWLAGPWQGRWMNTHLPESIVALGAAVLLFLLPVNLSRWEFTLTWPEAVKIDWGTILLFGGGLALGSLMFKTGVAEAIGHGLVGYLGVSSLWGLTGVSIAMAMVISEAASNTASANMIIPVVIAIAQAAGISPLPPAMGACLGASFGFMLPVSTPPNAIVYGSGLVPLPTMMRAGILLDILGFCIIWGGLYLVYQLGML